MNVIIAGSRNITDRDKVFSVIEESDFEIEKVLSGACEDGVDVIGEEWAEENDVPVEQYPPDWDKYSRAAGPKRNGEMARDADALIAVWDGESRGTRSMIEKALIERLQTHIVNTGAERGLVTNNLTEEELLERLPEIDQIDHDKIRQDTIDFFLDHCPDHFWELPTSSSGRHHPKDEITDHGNWLHTKRVYAMYDHLSRSLIEQGDIMDYQRECGKAAALIHDMLKYGWPPNGGHTEKFHDVLCAEVVRQYSELPEEVARLVDSHNGGWYVGKDPENKHEDVLHYSDMAVAKRGVLTDVLEPTEELNELTYYPDEAKL